MATTTSNFVHHVQAASAQLTQLAHAQANTPPALTDQFEKHLAEQSTALVDLAATVPQALRPTIQAALTAVTEARTELHVEENHPSTSSSEPTATATPISPTHTPAVQTAPPQNKPAPTSTPLPPSHQRAQPSQQVQPTALPPAAATPEHQTRHPANTTPRRSSDQQVKPTVQASTLPIQVQAAHALPAPTSAAPVEKTQREERKAPASPAIAAQSGAVAQSDTVGQQAASTPPSAPTQQSAPTDAGESNTPNHTQEHKAVAPASDKIPDKIEPTADQQQEQRDQQNEPAPQASHDPARSAPSKEPRPKL